jgi:ABC-type transport system substrate-binding protein
VPLSGLDQSATKHEATCGMSFPTLQALYERMASVDTCEESSLVKAFDTPDTQQYSYETEKAEDLLGKAGFPKQLDGWRFKLDHVFIP